MITQINDKIQFLETGTEINLLTSNSLYINDAVKVLFDTSCGKENLRFLQKQLVDVIINTHFHIDHTLGNHFFPQAQIWAHEKDAPAIESFEMFEQYNSFLVFNEKEEWDRYLSRFEYHPSKVSRRFQGEELLDFGTVRVQVIHTPGHTPGHCCFLFEDSVIFTADLDLRTFGPWYGHMCSNINDLINSIKKLMEIRPKMIITSHNGIVTDNIQQQLQNYLDIIFRREEKILQNLERPRTLEELTDLWIIYGPVKRNLKMRRVFERMAIALHLERLLELGQIGYNPENKSYFSIK